MSKYLQVVVAGLIAAWLFTGWTPGVPIAPQPKNLPSVEEQSAVSALRQLPKGNGFSGSSLADFYMGMADIIERDSDAVASLGQFKMAHAEAEKLMFQKTNLEGQLGPWAAEVNKVLSLAVGGDGTTTPDVALTPQLRAKLVASLRAISWAAEN